MVIISVHRFVANNMHVRTYSILFLFNVALAPASVSLNGLKNTWCQIAITDWATNAQQHIPSSAWNAGNTLQIHEKRPITIHLFKNMNIMLSNSLWGPKIVCQAQWPRECVRSFWVLVVKWSMVMVPNDVASSTSHTYAYSRHIRFDVAQWTISVQFITSKQCIITMY